jgi:branched-chain amino acid transport system permease protein
MMQATAQNPTLARILGGVILGILDNLSAAYLSSQYRAAFPLLILIVVILVRPQGLLGRAGR